MRDDLNLDSTFVYESTGQIGQGESLPITIPSGTIFVSNVNGIAGSITISAGTTGLTVTPAGSTLTLAGTLAVANGGTGATSAGAARTALGAAASGINTDITQLNGASQVDVTGSFKKSGVQVVGAQGAAVADAAGGVTIDTEARTAINDLLAQLRVHGLIAT